MLRSFLLEKGAISEVQVTTRFLNPQPLSPKRTLNQLTKLVKWLSCIVSIYLYGAFDCVFLSCHICVLEWIYSLQLPESQEKYFLKQAWYLKFKWQQRDLNSQTFSLQTNTKSFSQTGQIIGLYCEYIVISSSI